jgi:hypothetical protein
LRSDNRKDNEIRELHVLKDVQEQSDGSCLISLGNTRVLCAVRFKNTGTLLSMLTAHNTLVLPKLIKQEPSDCSCTSFSTCSSLISLSFLLSDLNQSLHYQNCFRLYN